MKRLIYNDYDGIGGDAISDGTRATVKVPAPYLPNPRPYNDYDSGLVIWLAGLM